MSDGRVLPITDEELRRLPLPIACAIKLVGFLPATRERHLVGSGGGCLAGLGDGMVLLGQESLVPAEVGEGVFGGDAVQSGELVSGLDGRDDAGEAAGASG